MLGCSAKREDSACPGMFTSFLGKTCHYNLLVAAVALSGHNPVHVLDLTPLYRELPRPARLGLDPRLASWFGVPEAESQTATPFPFASPEAAASDGQLRTSKAAAPMDWEAKLFSNGLRAACEQTTCNLSALRWHRVYALGHHVQWTPEGVVLMTPPPGTSYAEFPGEAEEAIFQDTPLPRMTTVLDYPAANTTVLKGGKQMLRYPILTFNSERNGMPSGLGVYAATAFPLGMTGRLGWLGVPSIGIGGGGVGSFLLSQGLVTLDIMAVAAPAALEGIWNDSAAIQPGALERMDPAHSEALDEAVVFWGLWGDIDSQQGLSPPGLSGVGSVEVPLSQLGVPRLQDAVPDHPLVDWIATGGGEYPVSGVLEQDMEEVGYQFRSPSMAMAIRGWEVLVEGSCYGASVYSYDLALWEPGGFARWPGETATLFMEIEDDLSREALILIPGGCLQYRDSLLQLGMLCLYVSFNVVNIIVVETHAPEIFCIVQFVASLPSSENENWRVMPPLNTIFSARLEVSTSMWILHGATIQWWPKEDELHLGLEGKGGALAYIN